MAAQIIPLRPGEYFFRRLYAQATTNRQRDAIFYAQALDHDYLREWVEATFGVAPPRFVVTQLELKHWPPSRVLFRAVVPLLSPDQA